MSDLDKHRQAIDEIDAEIINLIGQRQKEVQGVIRAKAQTGKQPLQPARFKAVVERCRRLAEQNELDPDVVEDIWVRLHEYFLGLEEAALNNRNKQ